MMDVLIAPDEEPRIFVWWILPRFGRIIPTDRAHCFEQVPGGWRSVCGYHWVPDDDRKRPRGIYHVPQDGTNEPACRTCSRLAP